MALQYILSILLLFVSIATMTGCHNNNTENNTVVATSKNIETKIDQNVSLNVIGATSSANNENEKTNIIGKWQVEYIAERPVIDNSPAQFIFLDNGRLVGSASCNNMFSSYSIDTKNKTLSINPGGITRKMCFGGLMEQEDRFINQLSKVSFYKIELGILFLSDKEHNQLFKASRIK